MTATPVATTTDTSLERGTVRSALNRVPAVTAWFWIIKVLATTVGETAADYLNDNLGLGLTNTSLIMAALLGVLLAVQFGVRRYVPAVYWSAVVLISVVGTLITDNLSDNLGVSLWVSTGGFSVLLAATFAWWYRHEGTLSIHTIFTATRERFYWLAVLFTFALGTAGGDLVAEQLGLGYGVSLGIFAAAIALVLAAHRLLGLGAVLSFWMAYILTRPLGASFGDLMSQPTKDGGFGLGTTGTSVIFLLAILAVVSYLSVSRVDRSSTPGSTSLDATDDAAR